MKKSILFVVIMTLGYISALFASDVNQTTAEKVAIKYFYEVNIQSGMEFEDVLVKEAYAIMSEGEAVYYAFNFVGNGFVIVSADDARNPIIGYSLVNNYSNVNQAENFASFMSLYNDEINYLRENKIEATPEIASRWNHLLEDVSESKEIRAVVVEPLCPAIWNQDNPYNYYCPIDEDGPGDRVYAGCVATAMSMVMYYWRWPFEGEGSSSYYASGYGTLSADYANADYDPHGMINKPTNVLSEQGSMLMYHCGVAVEMMYGADGSGAYSNDVPMAVRNHFKYSMTTSYKMKSSYSHTNWINLIKGQLDSQYPVYYSGQSSTGGHAFVCDGYDDNFNFHFNFGWSGSGNGFFSLTDVGGFSGQQAAVTGMKPDTDEGYPYYCSGSKTFNYLQGTIGDGSGPIEDYQNNANATWLISPESNNYVDAIDITFHKFDLAGGDYLRIYDGETTSAELLGEFTGSDIPEDISSTVNKVLVEFVTNGSSTANGFVLEWDCSTPDFCSGLTTFTEDEATFTDGSEEFKYANGTTCMYQIVPEWGTEITLTIEEFDTDVADKVRIYDGNTMLDEISGTYSAGDLPGPYTATEGSILIQFNANSYVNGQGFKVHYAVDNVGVEDIPQISEIAVVPNPATSMMAIRFKTNKAQDVKIAMFSATGQTIFQENHIGLNGNYDNTIDVSSFAKGISH